MHLVIALCMVKGMQLVEVTPHLGLCTLSSGQLTVRGWHESMREWAIASWRSYSVPPPLIALRGCLVEGFNARLTFEQLLTLVDTMKTARLAW